MIFVYIFGYLMLITVISIIAYFLYDRILRPIMDKELSRDEDNNKNYKGKESDELRAKTKQSRRKNE